MSSNNLQQEGSLGSVELATTRRTHEPTTPNKSPSMTEKQVDIRQQLQRLLKRSGLPHKLIDRLMLDVNGGDHYRRCDSINDLTFNEQNSSYWGNCCSGFYCHSHCRVQQGQLAKVKIDDEYLFYGPGYHSFTTFGSEFCGVVNTAVYDTAVVFGSAGFVTITEGNIGVLLVGAEYRLLAPGTYEWNSPAVTFLKTVDVTTAVAKLGPFTLITIPDGMVSITYHNGDLKVLGNRPSALLSHQALVSGHGVEENPLGEKSSQTQMKNVIPTTTTSTTSSSSASASASASSGNAPVSGINLQHLLSDDTLQKGNYTFDSGAISPLQLNKSNQSQQENKNAPDNNNNNNNNANVAAASATATTIGMTSQFSNSSFAINPLAEKQQQQQFMERVKAQRTFFLDDPKHLHSCFLSLKTQTDRLEGNDLLSKDNVEILMVAMSQWRICDPVLAINECADDMESIRHKVNQLVRATIARIVAGTAIGTGPVSGASAASSHSSSSAVTGTVVNESAPNTSAPRSSDADLAHLMQSEQATSHMSELTHNLRRMGVEIVGVFVPSKRMKNDDIRREVALQATIFIKAEAERSAADASAYSKVTAAKAEAEAINELARAHADAGKRLGNPNETAARMALSEITAKSLTGANVTMFSGPMDQIPFMFTPKMQ